MSWMVYMFCLTTGVYGRITNDLYSMEFQKSFKDLNVEEQSTRTTYRPDWSDLGQRPLPEWFDKAKVGIFIHWGVYSVPGFGDEWFWYNLDAEWPGTDKNITDYEFFMNQKERNSKYMSEYHPPGFKYEDFAQLFTAEYFDPKEWATLFKEAGARYVVLTAKHYDGYALYPSSYSLWNSFNVGPRRDLVGDLAQAVRDAGMKFGVQFTLYEWFNPMLIKDIKNEFATRTFVDLKIAPEYKELVNKYKPSVVWVDNGMWTSDQYWNSTELVAWTYNESPVGDDVVVNDRWCDECTCRNGDFNSCLEVNFKMNIPDNKWVSLLNLYNGGWAYLESDEKTISSTELITVLIITVCKGGNFMLNVAPSKEGTIKPNDKHTLLAIGEWLKVNGEAIYDTSPWYHLHDDTITIWFTCKKTPYEGRAPTAPPSETDVVTDIYAFFFEYPRNGIMALETLAPYINEFYTARLLGYNEALPITITNFIVYVDLPNKFEVKANYAWVLQFSAY